MTKLEQLNNSSIIAEEYKAPTQEVQTRSFSLTRGHWLLIAIGLMSMLFIAFITIARSIQIEIVTDNIIKRGELLPVDAGVDLTTTVKLPLGNRILLLPGKHTVKVSAEGFENLEKSIEVGAGRNQQFQIILQPLPGQLEVNLTPKVAARVSLNGELIGSLPGVLENVPAGQHELTVDAPLYRAVTRSIIVQGRGQTETLAVTLDPAWGDLFLDSLPNAVTVLIDGQNVGQTPIQVKVEEGNHILSLTADKYKPFTQEFTMIAEQSLNVPAVKLVPADGTLEINTSPASAAIVLNGEYRGVSPLTLKLKPDQPQTVQIYKSGYRLKTEQVSLAPDQLDKRQINLIQDVASVRFSISPSSAELIIDGVRHGSGSQTVLLNTLPHKIRVRKEGYVSFQNEIIPTRSNQQIVSVRLLTKEQHFWANISDRYNTLAGQEMKLFKSPGKVKLGSSRRETGRRANEVTYTAQLNKHFYVSLNEVTNKQFRAFKPTHNSGNYKRKSLDSNKHPVANVSWQQAALYCNWLSDREKLTPFYRTKKGYVAGHNPDANGYRLLTEVEWAWLARNKGEQLLVYPWGNSIQIPAGKPIANFADVQALEYIAFTVANYDDGYQASAPIGRYPANHKGLFDIDGNVREWVNDWYSSNSRFTSDQTALQIDPLGPQEGEFHVIRGASWARGHIPQLRLAYRDFGAKGTHDVGFRIARYIGAAD